jgi:hypothetical protein
MQEISKHAATCPARSARDTRKEAMTRPRFKEVVPYDQHAPEPAGYSPTPDRP